jgi:hypothetical protein
MEREELTCEGYVQIFVTFSDKSAAPPSVVCPEDHRLNIH